MYATMLHENYPKSENWICKFPWKTRVESVISLSQARKLFLRRGNSRSKGFPSLCWLWSAHFLDQLEFSLVSLRTSGGCLNFTPTNSKFLFRETFSYRNNDFPGENFPLNLVNNWFENRVKLCVFSPLQLQPYQTINERLI